MMNTISTMDNSKINVTPRNQRYMCESPNYAVVKIDTYPDMFSFNKKSSNDVKFEKTEKSESPCTVNKPQKTISPPPIKPVIRPTKSSTFRERMTRLKKDT